MGAKDSITKEYIRNNKVFADAFNYFLYDGECVIEPDKLVELDTTELVVPYYENDKGMQTESLQRFRDSLKEASVMCGDDATYVILGIENQSNINYAMPVKNIVYDVLHYSSQVTRLAKERRRSWMEDNLGKKPGKEEFLSGITKEDKLIPVITLVIHFSDSRWDGPMSLRDMMATEDEKILSFVPDYRINLIEPEGMTEEEIAKFESTLREVFSFIKYSKNKEKLLNYIQTEERMTHLSVEAAKVIKVITGSKFKIQEGMEEVNMCQAEMEWGMEREEKGRLEGRLEGTNRMTELMDILLTANRIDDAKRVTKDIEFRSKLMKEYKLDI